MNAFLPSLISAAFIGGAAAYLGSLMLSRQMALLAGPLGHLTLPGRRPHSNGTCLPFSAARKAAGGAVVAVTVMGDGIAVAQARSHERCWAAAAAPMPSAVTRRAGGSRGGGCA
jgi:ABC-type Mn2+/Zn2+ transport system permease subunit